MQRDPVRPALRHGPEITEDGVIYRLWSPNAESISAQIVKDRVPLRTISLAKESSGWFTGLDRGGRAGDLYEFLLDGKNKIPDVASRFQPNGVRGPSQVVDARNFPWRDKTWKSPALEDLVIYELHVGTFTQEGTFAAAIKHLEHLAKLGVNALQLMPVGEFPGERNWGYDIVLHFAPAHAYGHPDDLRRLVDAAHARGLAVIMDVVYNHVCGEPNILKATSPHYFQPEGSNAWGDSLNFDGEQAAAVRAFFTQNAVYWFEEFHVDGLRLDATHAIADRSPIHVLREISDLVHQRGGLVIAEDDRNEALLLRPPNQGGTGMDAVWADDFHHVMKMALKPEPIGHFLNYQGTSAELVDTLDHGWLFRGQNFLQWKKPRGTACREIAPAHFVYCISNHDQAGNRPLGERLNQLISARAYRAASMFFLLLPYTPMLFMGQEWAAATPFVFFTNHEGGFGEMVSEGRRKEFQHFGSQWPAETLAAMPNPEQAGSFLCSKLDWAESAKPSHAEVLLLYQECLRLRDEDPVLRRRDRENWKVWSSDGWVYLRYGSQGSPSRLLITRLNETQAAPSISIPDEGWTLLLSSNETCYGGTRQAFNPQSRAAFDLKGCETILLGKES